MNMANSTYLPASPLFELRDEDAVNACETHRRRAQELRRLNEGDVRGAMLELHGQCRKQRIPSSCLLLGWIAEYGAYGQRHRLWDH